MKYCSIAEIIALNPKLGTTEIDLDFRTAIATAAEIVRADTYFLDYGTIDWNMRDNRPAPQQLKTLNILKARELLYVQYYMGKIPEKSEADKNKLDYEARLNKLESLVLSGKITPALEAVLDSTKYTEFV